ncbi:hypothetical protein [Pinibacter soli]|uniref:Uncharacterized protein n=1 Tax=Pinibacter soli TaxID=3044211 RepID=A0ABT6RH92_9BACT|nr:hypothetical protein [Pinibacter soli]MDI3321934.1 hypothetical protein [Pinibacter soli]
MEIINGLITTADVLSALILLCTILFILLKKGMQFTFLKLLAINAGYNLIITLLRLFLGHENPAYAIGFNLTRPVDIITALLILYVLWDKPLFRKFLVFSVIPVMVLWLKELCFEPIDHIHLAALIPPSMWSIIITAVALALLYQKPEKQNFVFTRFLIVSGFMIYNFTYFIIEALMPYYFFAKTFEEQRMLVPQIGLLNLGAYFFTRVILLLAAADFLSDISYRKTQLALQRQFFPSHF